MSEEGSNAGDTERFELGAYEGGRNENGERHGQGKASFTNGDVYEGEYANGTRNGNGVYCFRQAKYTGEYKDGKRHGKGFMHYPDGSTYTGSWVCGARNGPGLYTYVNGDTYDGEWKDDRRHGVGTYTHSATNAQYNGHWSEGHCEGPAEITNDNYKYVGFYKEDVPVGRGKFTFQNGCQQSGFYEMTNVIKQVAKVMELVGQEPRWRCTHLRGVKEKPSK